MKLYQLERTQILPVSQNQAWQFFSQPRNLPDITPPWLGFRITCSADENLHAGQVFSYRLKPIFGIPATWISEITHVHEPDYFIDEQRFGPYRFWHHRHIFKPVDSGTLIHDVVHYAIGWGMFGQWVQRLIVAPRLERIFNYRQEKLEQICWDTDRLKEST
jgi:ligand-binding SRPBCC domain-containing protein